MADLFDRFSGSGALSAHTADTGQTWTVPASDLSISVGSVYPSGTPSDGSWPFSSYTPASPNYSAAIVLGADLLADAAANAGVAVRLSGTAPNESGYFLILQFDSGAFHARVYYIAGMDSPATQLGTTQVITPAANDTWTLQVSGTSNPVTLTVYQNGTQVYQTTDSAATITTAGTIGLRILSGDGTHTDQVRALWAGANASGPPAITIAPPTATAAWLATQSFGLSTALTNETFSWSATHGSISGTAATETYTAPGSGTTDSVVGTSVDLPLRTASAAVTLTGGPTHTSHRHRKGPNPLRRAQEIAGLVISPSKPAPIVATKPPAPAPPVQRMPIEPLRPAISDARPSKAKLDFPIR